MPTFYRDSSTKSEPTTRRTGRLFHGRSSSTDSVPDLRDGQSSQSTGQKLLRATHSNVSDARKKEILELRRANLRQRKRAFDQLLMLDVTGKVDGVRAKGRGPPPVKASYWPRQTTLKRATPPVLPLEHFFRTQSSSPFDVNIFDPAIAEDTSAHGRKQAGPHLEDSTNLHTDARDLEQSAKVLEDSGTQRERRFYRLDETADPSTASVSDDSDRALELSLDRPPPAPPYQFPTPSSSAPKGKAPGTSLDGPKTPATATSAASGSSSGKPAKSSACRGSANKSSTKVNGSIGSRVTSGSNAPTALPPRASLSRIDSASSVAASPHPPPPPSGRRLAQRSNSQASTSRFPAKSTGGSKASAPTKNGFLAPTKNG